ncbi:hypothetical protein LEMLEM_LOCUS19559 [Lemmus lemmus]
MLSAPRCGQNLVIPWKYMSQKQLGPSEYHQTCQTQRQSHSPRITQRRISSGLGYLSWSLYSLAFFCMKIFTAKDRSNTQPVEKIVHLSRWQRPQNKAKNFS